MTDAEVKEKLRRIRPENLELLRTWLQEGLVGILGWSDPSDVTRLVREVQAEQRAKK